MTSTLLKCAVSAALAAGLALGQSTSKVEIDNTWVHVLRLKQGPHEKTAMQAHLPTVTVYLTDARQRFTTASGKTQETSHRAGDVAYRNAVNESEENIAEQPLEAVIIELKPGAPKSPPVKLDPVTLDPEHHIVVLENDRVRAIRTILEPHLKSPLHEHPHYVVVYLTDLHTTMKLGDGRTLDNPRRPGEVAWRDALQHVTENIGEHTAEEIQVELK